MGERRSRVAIVGAGLAGLSAARALDAGGCTDVVVVEARDRVGGRTLTEVTAAGATVDHGAQWIGPTQDHVDALAHELGVEQFATFDAGQNVEYRAGARHPYAGPLPMSDPAASADLIQAILEVELLSTEVPVEAPWTAARALEWDSQTVATWLRDNVASEAARALLGLGVEAIFAAEPRDLSFLGFLFYVASAGRLTTLIGVTGGAQERRFVGGAQQVSVKLAAALGEERIALRAPVRRISQDAGGVTLEADGGVTVRAERAIVAVPPAIAGRIAYSPFLGARRDGLTQRMPMGSVYKVHAVYDEPFWRADGLSGQATSDEGPVGLTFDNSPADGSPGVLLGFIEGAAAREAAGMDPTARRDAVLACFARFFGEKAASPVEYLEHTWAEEEFTGGCYTGYAPPGVLTSYGPALREPIGRLHWAGTETATVWNGYMEGAIRSGERAAAEVLAALGSADSKAD